MIAKLSALLAAMKKEKIGSIISKLILFCFLEKEKEIVVLD